MTKFVKTLDIRHLTPLGAWITFKHARGKFHEGEMNHVHDH